MRLVFLFLFVFSSLTFAQKVFCYKKGVSTNEVDPFMVLDGSECKGQHSVEYMEENGWKLKETQFAKKDGKYDHFYFFEKKDKIDSDMNFLEDQKVAKRFNFRQQELEISLVENGTARVSKKGLRKGQSGVVIHKSAQENIILSVATVQSSDDKGSTIRFTNQKIYNQQAIPNTNLKPSNGDTFVLNHLYGSSLLIVPNNEAKQIIQDVYKDQLFINEDFFAAYLKLNDEPMPSKEMIQHFCKSNQLGTIFLVANDNLYIIDGMSFDILDMQSISLTDPKEQLPFFSKIEPVKGGSFFDLDLGINYNIFDDDYTLFKETVKKDDYNNYYLKMLGKQ